MLDGPGEEKLLNPSTNIFDKEPLVKEDTIDMSSNSPIRSRVGSGDGTKSPLRESGLTEFHGDLPKSPMRDRFLDDLVKTPVTMRDASRSPMRERGSSYDFVHDGINFPGRSRNVSKSPVKGRGGTPVSVRTRDVGRSPMRECTSLSDLDGVGRSTTRSMNGDVPKSPMKRGLGSDFKGNSEQESVGKITQNDSFKSWLPDDKHEEQSGDNYSGGRRSIRIDQAVYRLDQNKEGVKSVFSDEHDLTSEGSLDDSIRGMGRSKGGMYQDGRFKSAYAEGYARTNVIDRPSNYHPDPIYGNGGSRHSFESARGPASVHELQLKRVELLRKHKELEDQLSGLVDAEMSSSGLFSEPDGYSADESSRLGHGPRQQFLPDRNVHMQHPTQFNHGPGLPQNKKDMYNFNHPMYVDHYVGQMKSGPRSNKHLSKHTVPEYGPERSADFDRNPRDSYVNDTHVHHPACGCTLCYYSNDNQSRYRHSSLAHRRHGNLPANLTSSHSMDLEGHGPRSYDPRMAHTGPRGRSSQPLHHHKRVEVASLNKRLCRPISGGAPFVVCNNCFQLLKLPGNFRAKHKIQQLQCGACSTVISFDLQHKSFDSSSPQKQSDSLHVAGSSYEDANESGPKHHRRGLTATSTNIGSYDFDTGSYTVQCMGSEASRVTKGHKFNSSLPENTLGSASSPYCFSVDERISDTASVRGSQLNSSEPIGSPEEKQIIDNDTSLEPPSLDITNTTDLSHDSGDIPCDSLVPGNAKVAQSRIDALSKGFDSLSGHGNPRIAEVYVNGQAMSQRLVEQAEKLAGPIQPGEYWYDPKAGFWGVMGHQCMGIIPPSIQEFSFPMLENCSKGDSNVFVNGRELQERDLDLLARRGLPTTRDMRYVVDISGKVLDEQTKDFIANLGRLAPSVSRNKCGFGMQVPEQLGD